MPPPETDSRNGPDECGNPNINTVIQGSWRLENPIYKERSLRIICIGAGASGLIFTYKLQRSFENFELTVYEKNEDVSGTWFENRYPGCACDVAAHTYTYSFEPKPDWSSVFAGSAEIHQYFVNFSNKYGLRKFCRFKHQVVAAKWDDSRAKWSVDVVDLETGQILQDSCDFLINASGVLNAWKWPAIPGLQEYKGKLMHTANWDEEFDLTDKRVGLIGNGSSAIQVLPAIQPKVRELTTFIRTPTWVVPTFRLSQRNFSDEERQRFTSEPGVHLKYRKELECLINGIFPVFLKDSNGQALERANITAQMQERLKDDLKEKLIPTWGVGCRRRTPGVGYLEALGADNVRVVFGEIERITERGCLMQDGEEHVVEVLICGTGFDTSFKPRFPIIGLGGKPLAEAWSEEPKGYLGVAAPGFPNYFIFLGPNSPVANGPVLIAVEAQADYMLKMINRWQTENIHSFSPKMEAVDDFLAHKDEFMKKTVWEEDCRSWYKSNSTSGKVTAIWPGSTLHYLEAMSEVRYEDWNMRFLGNRFAFLGNGFSQVESDPSADCAYYILEKDESPYLSRGKHSMIFWKGMANLTRYVMTLQRMGNISTSIGST
ncbi:hypothetical protein AMATHDRAFT_4151 [Amanita thiersii Skay4041]|uniref:FAD/NAD(P)-binding domain-containing protein n=1 Tax=Amanita thiersii Skay4041 TaxID=703135 RepID=A0A2A9NRD1_9AGAR|nr:hypothetical protein AMATHDRAFT_4151 [Amanita thiersii Skay4041]